MLLPNPNRLKVKKNAIHCDKTQQANFRGGFLFQATKQQLNGEKGDVEYFTCFWFSCFVNALLMLCYVVLVSKVKRLKWVWANCDVAGHVVMMN